MHLDGFFLLRGQLEEGVDVVEHDSDRDDALIRAVADEHVEIEVRRIAVEGVVGDDPVTKRELDRDEFWALMCFGDQGAVADRVADEGCIFFQLMCVLVHQGARALELQLGTYPCRRRVDLLDEDGKGHMVGVVGFAEHSRMVAFVVLHPVQGDAQDCERNNKQR